MGMYFPKPCLLLKRWILGNGGMSGKGHGHSGQRYWWLLGAGMKERATLSNHKHLHCIRASVGLCWMWNC